MSLNSWINNKGGAFTTLIVGCVLGVIMALAMANTANKEEQKRIKITALETQFQEGVQQAIQTTGNPCVLTPFELVFPPEDLELSPVMVVMGEKIFDFDKDSPKSRSMWRMFYQLVPQKNRVELWVTQWRGEADPTADQDILRRKAGEKFFNNPSCADQ